MEDHESTSTNLAQAPNGNEISPARAPIVLRPVVDPSHYIETRQAVIGLLRDVMEEGVDYGVIPGTEERSLWQSGADKLREFFGLTFDTTLQEKIEIREPAGKEYYYYRYRTVTLWNGQPVASAEAICHSGESGFGYRWVPAHRVPSYLDKAMLLAEEREHAEPDWAIKRKVTSGEHGKPMAYWVEFEEAIREDKVRRFKRTFGKKEHNMIGIQTTMYRVPNPDVASQAHNMAMRAQKRSRVAAIKRSVGVIADIFTQADIEEPEEQQGVIEGQYTVQGEANGPGGLEEPQPRPAPPEKIRQWIRDVAEAAQLPGVEVKERRERFAEALGAAIEEPDEQDAFLTWLLGIEGPSKISKGQFLAVDKAWPIRDGKFSGAHAAAEIKAIQSLLEGEVNPAASLF